MIAGTPRRTTQEEEVEELSLVAHQNRVVESELSSVSITYLAPFAAPSGSGNRFS